MKPTSLSPEFYENLYNEIIRDYDFDPDCEDAEETQCSTYIEVEDFQGFYICLKATYELNLIDDSFDHAFGTEYGWHMEIGELIDIDEVTLCTEDDDVSDLFDYDAFFEQFKKREVTFRSGTVIKSGDTVIADCGYNRFEEVRFMYKDTLSGQYICERDNVLRPTKAYKRIYPDTETNRRNANLNIR
jgi:hypothetical protein